MHFLNHMNFLAMFPASEGLSKEADFNLLLNNLSAALSALSLPLAAGWSALETIECRLFWLFLFLNLERGCLFVFVSPLLLEEFVLTFKCRELLLLFLKLLLRFHWLGIEGAEGVLGRSQILTRLSNLLLLSSLRLFLFHLSLLRQSFLSSVLRDLSRLRSVLRACKHDILPSNLEPISTILNSAKAPTCTCSLLLQRDWLDTGGLLLWPCLHREVILILIQVWEIIVVVDVNLLLPFTSVEQVFLRDCLLVPFDFND